jgi:hypothetical protein
MGGLNWGQGLENASKGLDRMAKQKNFDAELTYRDMAEKNRMRFRSEEAGKQRDFLSSEAGIKRDWEEPFKTQALENQAISIEQAGEAQQTRLEIQKGQSEFSQQLGLLNLGQGQETINLRRSQLDAAAAADTAEQKRLSAKERRLEFKDERDFYAEALKTAEGKITIFNKDEHPALKEEAAKIKAALDFRTKQNEFDKEVETLSAEEEAQYNRAFEGLGTTNIESTHKASMKYAKMSKEQIGQIDAVAESLADKYPNNPQAAMAEAIMKISSGQKLDLGKKPEAKTSAPEDKTLPDGTTVTDMAEVGRGNLEAANQPGFGKPDFLPEVTMLPKSGRRGARSVPKSEPGPIIPVKTKEIRAIATRIAKDEGVYSEFLVFSFDVYPRIMKEAEALWNAQNTNQEFLAGSGGTSSAAGPAGGSK